MQDSNILDKLKWLCLVIYYFKTDSELLKSILFLCCFCQDYYSGTWSRRGCTSNFKSFHWLYHFRNPGKVVKNGNIH